MALATLMGGWGSRKQRRLAQAMMAAGLAAVAATEWRVWQADRLRSGPPALPALPAGLRPRVTVLVAAWRERGNLARLMDSFAALRYPDKELVLCAGGGDGTYEEAVARAGSGVVVLEQQPGEGKWRSLRRGLEQATGAIIFLTDADCALDNAAFETTLAPVITGEAEVVTGRTAPFAEDERRSLFIAYQGDEERYLNAIAGTESSGLHGRNCAVRRRALDVAGGFSGEVAIGTDRALAQRLRAAGFTIRVAAGSVIASEYHDEVGAYWRQRSRWLRNLAVHGAAAGDWNEVRHAVTTGAIGAALLGGPLAGALLGPAVAAVWAVLFAKATAGRVRRAAAVRRGPGGAGRPARHIALAPWWTLVDAVAWTLGLVDLALPSRRRRW